MERTETFIVEDRLVTDVGGTIGTSVLSTPGMIGMMERCSSILAFENLNEGQATVGLEVCIRHVAAALEGTECTTHAQLEEIVSAVDDAVAGFELTALSRAVRRRGRSGARSR